MDSVISRSFDEMQLKLYQKLLWEVHMENKWIFEDVTVHDENIFVRDHSAEVHACVYMLLSMLYRTKRHKKSLLDTNRSNQKVTVSKIVRQCLAQVFGFSNLIYSYSQDELQTTFHCIIPIRTNTTINKKIACLAMMECTYVHNLSHQYSLSSSTIESMTLFMNVLNHWLTKIKMGNVVTITEVKGLLNSVESQFHIPSLNDIVDINVLNPTYWMGLVPSLRERSVLFTDLPSTDLPSINHHHHVSYNAYFFCHMFLDLFCGRYCGLAASTATMLFRTYIDSNSTHTTCSSDQSSYGLMYGSQQHAVVLGKHNDTFYVSNSGLGLSEYHPKVMINQSDITMPFYVAVNHLPDCNQNVHLVWSNHPNIPLWPVLCAKIETMSCPETVERLYRELFFFLNHSDDDPIQDVSKYNIYQQDISSILSIITNILTNEEFIGHATKYYQDHMIQYDDKLSGIPKGNVWTIQNHHFFIDSKSDEWLTNAQFSGSCTFWSQMNWYVFQQRKKENTTRHMTTILNRLPTIFHELSVNVMNGLFRYPYVVGLIPFLHDSVILPKRPMDTVKLVVSNLMPPLSASSISLKPNAKPNALKYMILQTNSDYAEQVSNGWMSFHTRLLQTLHWNPSVSELTHNPWSYFFQFLQLYKFYRKMVHENIASEFFDFLKPLCLIVVKRILCYIVYLIEITDLKQDFPPIQPPSNLETLLQEHEEVQLSSNSRKKQEASDKRIESDKDMVYFRSQVLYDMLSIIKTQSDWYELCSDEPFHHIDMVTWWKHHFYLCQTVTDDYLFTNSVAFSQRRLPVKLLYSAEDRQLTIAYCKDDEWDDWPSYKPFFSNKIEKTCLKIVISKVEEDDILPLQQTDIFQNFLTPTFAFMSTITQPVFASQPSIHVSVKKHDGTIPSIPYIFKSGSSYTPSRSSYMATNSIAVHDHINRLFSCGPFDTSFLRKVSNTFYFPSLMTPISPIFSSSSPAFFNIQVGSNCVWNFAGNKSSNGIAYQMELWCIHLLQYSGNITAIDSIKKTEILIIVLFLCFQLEIAGDNRHRSHEGWNFIQNLCTTYHDSSLQDQIDSDLPQQNTINYLKKYEYEVWEIAKLVTQYPSDVPITIPTKLLTGVQSMISTYNNSYKNRYHQVILAFFTYFQMWCSHYLPHVDMFANTQSKRFILSTSSVFSSIEKRLPEMKQWKTEIESINSTSVNAFEVIEYHMTVDYQKRLNMQQSTTTSSIDFILFDNTKTLTKMYMAIEYPFIISSISHDITYQWKYQHHFYDVSAYTLQTYDHALSFFTFFPVLGTLDEHRFFVVHPLLCNGCFLHNPDPVQPSTLWIDETGHIMTLLPPSFTLWLTGIHTVLPCAIAQSSTGGDLRYTLVFFPTTNVPSFGFNSRPLFDDIIQFQVPFAERTRWCKLSDDQWEIEQFDSVDTLGFVFCVGVWAQQEWIVRRLLTRVICSLQYYAHDSVATSEPWFVNCLHMFDKSSFGSPLSSYIAHVFQQWNEKTNCFKCLNHKNTFKWTLEQQNSIDLASMFQTQFPTTSYCPITEKTVLHAALPFTPTPVSFSRDRWLHRITFAFEYGQDVLQFYEVYHDVTNHSLKTVQHHVTQLQERIYQEYLDCNAQMSHIEVRLPCPYRAYLGTLINNVEEPMKEVEERLLLLWKISIYGFMIRVLHMIRNAHSREEMDRSIRQFFTLSEWYRFQIHESTTLVERTVMQIVFEISVGFVIKTNQMQTIEILLDQLSSSQHRPVLQQIMGSGKSTVIVPYLTMYQLVIQGKSTVVIVQPPHLKQACFVSMQRIIVPWLMCPFQVVTPVHPQSCHETSLHWMGNRQNALTIVIASDVEWKTYYLQSRMYHFDWNSVSKHLCVIIDEFDTLFLPTSSEVNITTRQSSHQMCDTRNTSLWIEWYVSLIMNMIHLQETSNPQWAMDDSTRYRHDGMTTHNSFIDGHFHQKLYHHVQQLSRNDINVKYGFDHNNNDNESSRSAVPYLALNTPDPGSRFSDPDITCVLTIWLFHIIGLQDKDIQWIIALFSEDDFHPVSKYVSRVYGDAIKQKNTSWKLSMINDTQLIRIYLTHVIIPSICVMPLSQQNVSFIDVIDRTITPHMVGFSGTTLIESTIDPLCTFHGIQEDDQTNKIINKQLVRWPTVSRSLYQGLDSSQHWFDLWEHTLSTVAVDINCIALIDEAAWVRFESPSVFSQKLYDFITHSTTSGLTHINQHRVHNGKIPFQSLQIIYFDTDNHPACLPLQSCQTHSFHADRLTILLYDQKHIIGTDLPLPNQVRGFVSIHQQSRFSVVAQAAFRLRGLAVESPGHSVQFVTALSSKNLSTSANVVSFIKHNETIFKKSYRHTFLQQVMALRWRHYQTYVATSYTRYVHHPSILQHMSPLEILFEQWPSHSHPFLKSQKEIYSELMMQTDPNGYAVASSYQQIHHAQSQQQQQVSQQSQVSQDVDVNESQETEISTGQSVQHVLNSTPVPTFQVDFYSVHVTEWWSLCEQIPTQTDPLIRQWMVEQKVRWSPVLQILLSSTTFSTYSNQVNYVRFVDANIRSMKQNFIKVAPLEYECPLYQIYVEDKDILIWVTPAEFTLDLLYRHHYRPDILFLLLKQYRKDPNDNLLHRIQMLLSLHVLTHTRLMNDNLLDEFLPHSMLTLPLIRLFKRSYIDHPLKLCERKFWSSKTICSLVRDNSLLSSSSTSV